DKLEAGIFEHGITDRDVTRLRASLGELASKEIVFAYAKYGEARKGSGSHDKYGSFTKNEDGFSKFTAASKILLSKLRVK
ncbi:hypothetical protein, partial [Psychrobacter sp. HY3-MNA-CIBAN-0198]